MLNIVPGNNTCPPVGREVRHKGVGTIMYSIRRPNLAGRGRVVAPDQDAGVLDIFWEELGVLQPTDTRVGCCPRAEGTAVEAVDSDNTGMRERLVTEGYGVTVDSLDFWLCGGRGSVYFEDSVNCFPAGRLLAGW